MELAVVYGGSRVVVVAFAAPKELYLCPYFPENLFPFKPFLNVHLGNQCGKIEEFVSHVLCNDLPMTVYVHLSLLTS